MIFVRRALPAALVAVMLPTAIHAQWRDVPAFAGAVVLVGAQGFARPPITSGVGSVYGHVPAGPVLLGIQASETFLEDARSHARYAIATLAFAQRRGLLWQVYPYVGSGAAAFRTQPGSAGWRPAFAAGFGIDVIGRANGLASMFGGRIGYITRSMGDDESVAYAAIGVGAGGRRTPRPPPRLATRRDQPR